MPFEIKTVSTLLAFTAILSIVSFAFANASSTIEDTDAIVPTIVAATAVAINYTTARALIPHRVPPSS